jgi:hypothetical protein
MPGSGPSQTPSGGAVDDSGAVSDTVPGGSGGGGPAPGGAPDIGAGGVVRSPSGLSDWNELNRSPKYPVGAPSPKTGFGIAGTGGGPGGSAEACPASASAPPAMSAIITASVRAARRSRRLTKQG